MGRVWGSPNLLWQWLLTDEASSPPDVSRCFLSAILRALPQLWSLWAGSNIWGLVYAVVPQVLCQQSRNSGGRAESRAPSSPAAEGWSTSMHPGTPATSPGKYGMCVCREISPCLSLLSHPHSESEDEDPQLPPQRAVEGICLCVRQPGTQDYKCLVWCCSGEGRGPGEVTAGKSGNEWQSPGPCQSLLICDKFYHSLVSCSSNVSIASTEGEKAHGWESFSLSEQEMKKPRRKRRPRWSRMLTAQDEGPSPHVQDFFPFSVHCTRLFPRNTLCEWSNGPRQEPWDVLVTGQLWCSWILHHQSPWVPVRVFPEIITGTITSPYWIISLTNFVIKHFQIKHKLKKKKSEEGVKIWLVAYYPF